MNQFGGREQQKKIGIALPLLRTLSLRCSKQIYAEGRVPETYKKTWKVFAQVLVLVQDFYGVVVQFNDISFPDPLSQKTRF